MKRCFVMALQPQPGVRWGVLFRLPWRGGPSVVLSDILDFHKDVEDAVPPFYVSRGPKA